MKYINLAATLDYGNFDINGRSVVFSGRSIIDLLNQKSAINNNLTAADDLYFATMQNQYKSLYDKLSDDFSNIIRITIE
jgi:hypothetical protein